MLRAARATMFRARLPPVRLMPTMRVQESFQPTAQFCSANVPRCSMPRRHFSSTTAALARGRFTGGGDQNQPVPNQSQPEPAVRQSEYDALTPEVRQHMVRVYNVMGSGVATASVGVGAMLASGLYASSGVIIGCSLGALVPILWLSFKPPSTYAGRLALFHSATSMIGAGITPIVLKAAGAGVLGSALVMTGAVFGGFSAAALLAPRGAALSMMGPLIACLMGMILMQLVSAFIYPVPFMHQIALFGGLALFSLLIAADTGAMIERARQGIKDPVQDALSMFLNLVNVFVRMVEVLSMRN